MEALTTFCLCLPDVLHDASNAFLWSPRRLMPFESTSAGVFSAVTAVRNGYDLIMVHLPGWLGQAVVWTDAPAPEGLLQELWGRLDLEEDVVDTLVKLRVRTARDGLQVWARWRVEPHTFEELAAALMGTWRFLRFTETR